MSATFFDIDGNKVTALELVTAVEVKVYRGVGAKRSDGNYGSNDVTDGMGVTLRADVPPGLRYPEGVNNVVGGLHEYAQNAIDATLTGVTLPAPVPAYDPDTARDAGRSIPPPEMPFGDDPTATTTTDGYLEYAPAAADRRPGQWWVEEADSYEWDTYTKRGGGETERIQFFKEGLDYAVATVYLGSYAWPSGWLAHMTKDGKRHPFAKPIYVVTEVGEKKNNKGNYYADIQRLTTERDKAVLNDVAIPGPDIGDGENMPWN